MLVGSKIPSCYSVERREFASHYPVREIHAGYPRGTQETVFDASWDGLATKAISTFTRLIARVTWNQSEDGRFNLIRSQPFPDRVFPFQGL